MLQVEGYTDFLGKLPDYYWNTFQHLLKPRHLDALPVLLCGDECQALGESFMILTWQSELKAPGHDCHICS